MYAKVDVVCELEVVTWNKLLSAHLTKPLAVQGKYHDDKSNSTWLLLALKFQTLKFFQRNFLSLFFLFLSLVFVHIYIHKIKAMKTSVPYPLNHENYHVWLTANIHCYIIFWGPTLLDNSKAWQFSPKIWSFNLYRNQHSVNRDKKTARTAKVTSLHF